MYERKPAKSGYRLPLIVVEVMVAATSGANPKLGENAGAWVSGGGEATGRG